MGETGSGKSTQIAQYLAEEDKYHPTAKKVVCTQPRGIAASSLAERIAEEWNPKVPVGGDIGYVLSGERPQLQKYSRLALTTDTVLLNELTRDRMLTKYSAVIVDEAHERAIHTDLLIGFLKEILMKRKDFRVIVTSATINEQLFSDFFGGCPVVKISGRLFPVVEKYATVPLMMNPQAYREAAIEQVSKIVFGKQVGDVLVFMPTQVFFFFFFFFFVCLLAYLLSDI